MVFLTDYEIYDALPISSDALDKGGLELLRAGVVDEELFITARRVFAEPAQWGYVLADITRRLAAIYAAESEFTEAEVGAAITDAFDRSLRSGEGAVRASPYPSLHLGGRVARGLSRRNPHDRAPKRGPNPNPPPKPLRAASARAPNREAG
jgi:hypothetical protein